MTSREKAMNIFNRKNVNDCVFWTGHPNHETIPIYSNKWGITPTRESIYNHLDDDCRWFKADDGYKNPENLPMWDPSYNIDKSKNLSSAGCFAEIENIKELDNYIWPDAKYFDFTEIYSEIDKHNDKMVFTGLWSCFFHNLCDFFGMENYFIKMYENPKVVEAATERMTDFYVEANDMFFKELGDRADVMFFGNDFGTQLDLFISPDNFRQFIMPSFNRLIKVGKKYNKKIMLHSCGSIYRIIPDLIDAGVDIIHPIQAGAKGMGAEDLSQYKNDLSFVGGIDAQSFLVDSTPEQVSDEVKRVRSLLGPNIVISPSHEEILPNIPAENMLFMSKAAHNII